MSGTWAKPWSNGTCCKGALTGLAEGQLESRGKWFLTEFLVFPETRWDWGRDPGEWHRAGSRGGLGNDRVTSQAAKVSEKEADGVGGRM